MKRVYYRLRYLWKTRHWDRSHGPGCPALYRTGPCLDWPDWMNWCRAQKKGGER